MYYYMPLDDWRNRSAAQKLRLCLMLNLVTHPFIFIVLPQLHTGAYEEYIIMAELIAILGEGYMLGRAGYAWPLRVSLLANLCSWHLGVMLMEQLGGF